MWSQRVRHHLASEHHHHLMQILTTCTGHSISVNKDHQKQFAFSWQEKVYTFFVLHQSYINSSHHLVCRNQDHHLPLSQEITLVYHMTLCRLDLVSKRQQLF